MITTTIRGRRWPNRRARATAGIAMASLSAYHFHRQGLYDWAVVLFTLASTTIVLRALSPTGPLWALSEEEPCSDRPSDTRRTGYEPAWLSPLSSPRAPAASTRRSS